MNKIKISKEELEKNGFKLKAVNSSNIIIKKVGNFEDEYVYDIEVKDGSHTFVADNILAHNSCVYTTVVSPDNKSIGELFDKYYEFNEPIINENGVEILDINDEYTYGLNGKSKIKSISRHKVNKDKWKISIDDTNVEVTGDHSIMIYRDGKIMECRAEDIRNTDMLLKRKK